MATTEENTQAIKDLATTVKDSNISLEALSGALMQFAIHADENTQDLRKEVHDHRRLSKYARRTHFWTMAAMVFGALFLADVAQHAHSQWWDLIFWATPHGGHGHEWALRIIGFVWQAGYLTFLVKIAQVPEDLWIASKQVKKEREDKKAAKSGQG